jgi:hypothetical protein
MRSAAHETRRYTTKQFQFHHNHNPPLACKSHRELCKAFPLYNHAGAGKKSFLSPRLGRNNHSPKTQLQHTTHTYRPTKKISSAQCDSTRPRGQLQLPSQPPPHRCLGHTPLKLARVFPDQKRHILHIAQFKTPTQATTYPIQSSAALTAQPLPPWRELLRPTAWSGDQYQPSGNHQSGHLHKHSLRIRCPAKQIRHHHQLKLPRPRLQITSIPHTKTHTILPPKTRTQNLKTPPPLSLLSHLKLTHLTACHTFSMPHKILRKINPQYLIKLPRKLQRRAPHGTPQIQSPCSTTRLHARNPQRPLRHTPRKTQS